MSVSHPDLADYLDRRREAITVEWLMRVHRDREIPSADDLPREQLIDHLPFLLDALIHRLRGTPHAATETTRQSQVHGETRADQNYSLPELLREVSILRNVLIEAWVEFDIASGSERRVQLESSGILHAILDGVIAESTAGFVSRQQAELLASNQALEEAHAQSEALNVQLLDLDERRLRMLRTITHEIANHLNAAGLMTSFLKRSATANDPDAQESLAAITRSISAMNSLMKQLLEFSLLASAAEKITLELQSPTALFDELVMIARSTAADKGLGFSSEFAPNLGPVNMDGNLLRRVGLNLLTNAIKYTAAGEVRLAFLPHDADHWRLEVSDTGCGIAPEDQSRIFDEFYRAKTPFEATPGVGLGLAITRQLVALLRGRIEVESQVGKGSTFRVILPKA
ncbi:MAG TPA: sensor histidine kinase [Chthoniobacterales bacterium]